ncbi:hypothetical protein V8E55_011208 [Tylopilus felleus]
MSFSVVVHDSVSHRTTKRSSLLSRRPNATPIPPTLVNSHYLSSPNSVFRRKITVPKWPSYQEDEWLRDMVPADRSPGLDADAKSEGSHDPNPSPTASDSSFGSSLFPPSPLLRQRSITPDLATPAKRALGGSGAGQSPHT